MPDRKKDDDSDNLPTQIVRGRVGPDPSKVPFRVSLVEAKSEIISPSEHDDDSETRPIEPASPRRGQRPPPVDDPDEDAPTQIKGEPMRRPSRAPAEERQPRRHREPETADTGPLQRGSAQEPMEHKAGDAMQGEPKKAALQQGLPADQLIDKEAMAEGGMQSEPAMKMESGPKMAEAKMTPEPMPELPTEPVVGFLVVIDGPGRGRFRPVYKGLSTIGRAASQRLRIDFGDPRIEPERHAILIYDDKNRRFFINHDGKAEVVRVNGETLIAPRELVDRDLITIGATTMAFVAFCGASFDWDVPTPTA